MEEEPYAYLASILHIKPVGQVLYNIYILTSALKVSEVKLRASFIPRSAFKRGLLLGYIEDKRLYTTLNTAY